MKHVRALVICAFIVSWSGDGECCARGDSGFVSKATLETGPGQVAITLVSSGGIITPGLATMSVR